MPSRRDPISNSTVATLGKPLASTANEYVPLTVAPSIAGPVTGSAPVIVRAWDCGVRTAATPTDKGIVNVRGRNKNESDRRNTGQSFAIALILIARPHVHDRFVCRRRRCSDTAIPGTNDNGRASRDRAGDGWCD